MKQKLMKKILILTMTLISIVGIGYTIKTLATVQIGVFNAGYNEAVVGEPIKMTITQEYSHLREPDKNIVPNPIRSFPVNKNVFNTSQDYFCIQHGVPYAIAANGQQSKGTAGQYLSDSGIQYISGEGLRNGKLDNYNNPDGIGYGNYHTGAFDISSDIKINEDPSLSYDSRTANTTALTNKGFQGYREDEPAETPVDTVYSNYVYKTKKFEFGCIEKSGDHCERKVEVPETFNSTQGDEGFDEGLAFLLARYKITPRGSYSNDPLQHAVWATLGQYSGGEAYIKDYVLKEARESFDKYHKEATEKMVDVIPSDDVGTVLSNGNYVVGPFKMNDYIRAEDYNYTVGGSIHSSYLPGDEGEDDETIDIDMPKTQENLQKIFYRTDSNNPTSITEKKELYGGILRAWVVFNDGSIYEFAKWEDKNVPAPGKEFKIEIPTSAVNDGADEIIDIVFEYQIIHAYGEGETYIGRQIRVSWNKKQDTSGGCTEYKTNYPGETGLCSYHGVNAGPFTSTTGGWQDTTHNHIHDCDDFYHGHGCAGGHYSSSCHACNCTGHGTGPDKTYCSCSGHKKAGCHCSCPGHTCSHTKNMLFLCDHKHVKCQMFDWQANNISYDACQDGATLQGKLSNEIVEYSIKVNVPLKTDMSIYKYISKVEHNDIAEHKTCNHTYNGGTERRDWEIAVKEADPVKVERGDIVTYTIELVNNSKFPTEVLVQDTLPDDILDEDRSDIRIRWHYETVANDWITIQPYSTETFEVTVVVDSMSGKYVNSVEFVSTNDKEPHMRYEHWGDGATHGPHEHGWIVNINNKIQDEDWYEVKEYKVNIDKYISDVEHTEVKSSYDSTMPESDARSKFNMSESDKQKAPVYVEYGDIVTYTIKIYNTTNKYDSSFDRTKAPHWEPEVVYVDIEDTLPVNCILQSIDVDDTYTQREATNEHVYLDDVRVEEDAVTTITIKVMVNDVKRTTVRENNVIILNDKIENINREIILNHTDKDDTSDWYKLNDYDIDIDKYISAYNGSMMKENNRIGFTENETSTIDDKGFTNTGATNQADREDLDRVDLTDAYKKDYPVEVEKTEEVIYSIKLENHKTKLGSQDAVATGSQPGTQVRPTKITDTLQTGLEFQEVKGVKYEADGTKVADVQVTATPIGNNTYEFTIGNGNETILDPGQFMVYYVRVKITESNMYLLTLENSAVITTLTNINHNPDIEERIVKDPDNPNIDENISPQKESKEYVKLKELIMAGKVFLDADKNGYMETENDKNRFNNITVKLYRRDGDGTAKQVGEKKTGTNKLGENGFYTFERVDKADDKQHATKVNDYYEKDGVYTANSKLYEYYIEFEYDGVAYKATEVYGGRTEDVNPNFGDNNITEKWLPTDPDAEKYITDSNAYEFTDIRDAFNRNYETIGYNKAYKSGEDTNNKTETAALTYTKKGHTSLLDVVEAPNAQNHPERVMTSRTFIKKEVVPVDGEPSSFKDKGIEQDLGYPGSLGYGKNLGNTKTLWLYKQGADYKLPETEYLKYMNLGLVEREDVNISLVKDVYSVTTTVNGEQITYDYNKNGVKNNEILIKGNAPVTSEEAQGATGTEFNESNGKYIDNQKYGLELYESDYYYRVEQYEHQAVRDYKTIYSELNIEVTFRITITNEEIIQDELNMRDVDREVIVTIDEIADYYDENFVEYTDNIESAYKAKLGTPNEDSDYKYMTQEEADTLDDSVAVKIKVKVPDEENIARDPGSTKLIDRKLEVVKAWYYKDGTTNPTGLIVTNKSNYNPERVSKNGEADGYRKLYIRGFNKVQLHEGESIDLYVKYIVDKEAAGNILSMTSGDSRNLKIAERLTKGEFGRGQEGIAEISAYSTWYQEYDTTKSPATNKGNELKPAGLVDRNSNPDNLGDDNSGAEVSVDEIGFYEDDTYKTGIEMTVPKPENPPNKPNPDPDPDPDPQRFIRKVSGRVWDDSRSNPGDNGNTATDTQYSGNGYLRSEDTKNPFAKMNDNVTQHYNVAENEEKDIMVRNARVDLIEIVQIGDRYYEEMIRTTDNTVHQYTTRTDENGNYILYGFKPGYYIVRFGYGDYVEGNQAIIDDMAIFNGQDYKSTKYTSAPDDEYDNDNIIKHLEEVDNNDARDDEIDRLNTISYSEIMINQKAEILKGNYVRDDNTNALVQTLLRNTAMNAETVKFMVKPEKMTGAQMDSYKFTAKAVADIPGAGGQFIYYDLENMMNEHIHQRDFSIENVNFGIEYRPESQVNLVKEIDNVSLITSDGNEILKLYVNTNIERDPNNPTIVTNRVHTIDTERSIGMDKTQFLTNEYTFTEMRNNILDELLEGQGFVYVNVDDDILQGSTVTIQYRFTAENVSEIDRIGKNLNDLRFKDNSAARTAYGNTASVGSLTNLIANEANTDVEYVGQLDEVWNKRFGFIAKGLISDKLYKYNRATGEIIGTNTVKPENTNFYDTEYTGSGTAGNILINQTYKIDENMDIYRVGLKKKYSNGEGYYGKYLGDYYYTAEATDNDVIAQIKFDKILDYVDNDLVFSAIQNAETNGYWGTTTATELKDGGYLSSLQRDNVFQEIENTYGETHWGILDRKGISFDSVKKANPNDQNSNKLEVLKTNLAVSISDRTTDDTNEGVKNLSMSRFLTPAVYDTATNVANGGYPTEVKGIIETPAAYYGQVMITVSKLISEETLSEDMAYENLAEIIQFTVTSGRRTNFITTIGNAKIENGEWSTSTEETDTSAAERITFTPPTGLTRTDRAIRKVVEKSSQTLMIVAVGAFVVAVAIFTTRFITIKIKKRRIK